MQFSQHIGPIFLSFLSLYSAYCIWTTSVISYLTKPMHSHVAFVEPTSVYLHCTSRVIVLSKLLPIPFDAVHLYLPESVLCIRGNLITWDRFVGATVFPSFANLISGIGFPVALHSKVTDEFSRTISLPIIRKFSGGSVDKI